MQWNALRDVLIAEQVISSFARAFFVFVEGESQLDVSCAFFVYFANGITARLHC